ncbi:MAG: translation elongation factor 4 [Candidatus Spechtbacterales bacterium]|nr:translation elongation factor 4 [Candidatus Spechtbacterales bacterium]
MKSIRNFVIIAHIDHGKSTLADRFLELTHSIEKRKMQEQYLDQMDLERERGITIKMQPVTMRYEDGGEDYTLNLIDTPGHVDFSYEVSRSLAAVEGAILLVDATNGIQAQTVAHLSVAIEQGLKIIPAINKIDLPQAQVKEVEEEILSLLISMDCDVNEIYKISAKTGEGIEDLLQGVIKEVPKPEHKPDEPLRALIFDSIYDDFRGVISYARIKEGKIKGTDKIYFMGSKEKSEAKEVGIFTPQYKKKEVLESGDIGYIVSGTKEIETAGIGDTITFQEEKRRAESPIPGYRQPQAVVFSTIFPTSDSNYDDLRDAFDKLKLNDASLYFEPEHSAVLGRGLKAGFLGMLHMEIILERLEREHDLELIVTAPSVAYDVKLTSGESETVFTPSQYPDPSTIEEVKEPWVHLKIIVSPDYMNNVMSLLKTIRGEYKDTEYIGTGRLRINYETPLAEIISDFYDNLKNVTSGFGSMAYEFIDKREVDLVKLDILLAGDEVPALARLVPKDEADKSGRKLVEKIKKVLPPEQFAVAIQAAIGGKIIARETKSALRKDVTAGMYGGDYTRKRKLLEKQKKGKKRMKKEGSVDLDTDTMMKIFQ